MSFRASDQAGLATASPPAQRNRQVTASPSGDSPDQDHPIAGFTRILADPPDDLVDGGLCERGGDGLPSAAAFAVVRVCAVVKSPSATRLHLQGPVPNLTASVIDHLHGLGVGVLDYLRRHPLQLRKIAQAL